MITVSKTQAYNPIYSTAEECVCVCVYLGIPISAAVLMVKMVKRVCVLSSHQTTQTIKISVLSPAANTNTQLL